MPLNSKEIQSLSLSSAEILAVITELEHAERKEENERKRNGLRQCHKNLGRVRGYLEQVLKGASLAEEEHNSQVPKALAEIEDLEDPPANSTPRFETVKDCLDNTPCFHTDACFNCVGTACKAFACLPSQPWPNRGDAGGLCHDVSLLCLVGKQAQEIGVVREVPKSLVNEIPTFGGKVAGYE